MDKSPPRSKLNNAFNCSNLIKYQGRCDDNKRMVHGQDAHHRPDTHTDGFLNTFSAEPAKEDDTGTKHTQGKRSTSNKQSCSCPITWSEFAFRSTGMGDVASPVILLLAIGKAADLFSPGDDTISRMAREQLQQRSYYDDIMVAANSPEERDRLINRVDYDIKRAGMQLHEWYKNDPNLKFPHPPSSTTPWTPWSRGSRGDHAYSAPA